MPRHQTGRTAQGARKSAVPRKARQRPVRRRERAAPQQGAPAPFAASLSALKLEPKGGIEVALTLDKRCVDGKQAKLLHDLMESYRAAERAWGNPNEGPFDFGAQAEINKAIASVVRSFKERFCRDDLDFIVTEHYTDGFYFTIFHGCATDIGWHVIEAKHFLYTCGQISRTCLELGYCFLRLLDEKAKMATWYDGSAEDQLEYLTERISDGADESLPQDEWDDDILEAWRDIQSYKVGEAARASKRIREAKKLTPDQMISRLARIKGSHALIDQMVLMCDLLREPYSLCDFDNEECDADADGDNEGYIAFYEQYTLLWDFNDHLGSIWQEYLDAQWNSGAIPVSPCATFEVRPDRTGWTLDRFRKSFGWPKRFAELIAAIDSACKKCPKEKSRNRKEQALINILV